MDNLDITGCAPVIQFALEATAVVLFAVTIVNDGSVLARKTLWII
jgi:hypothetical protein